MLFLSHAGECPVSNHNSTDLGDERCVSIESTTCNLTNFKPFERTWLRIWWKSIKFCRGNCFVNVTLKYYDGRTKKSWKLTSDDSQRMTNFDVQEAGDWFQIKSVNVFLKMRYMSYNSS